MAYEDFMFNMNTDAQGNVTRGTDRKFGTPAAGYQTTVNNIIDEVRAGRMGEDEAKARIDELQRQEFGASSFDIGEFEDLLNRLEGSKMRQQRQKSVEGRRDTMQQGLASMMGNF
jgi:polyhydroxyalkanoate synthesis regulator phasin